MSLSIHPALPPPRWRPDAKPLLVLVADDHASNRLILSAKLEHLGVTVKTASDGAQAVRLAGEQDFDLILMDVDMPVMNGLTATVEIRKREVGDAKRWQVPIVAHSALDFGANQASFWRAGMTSSLPKPCTLSSLRECLEGLCPDKLAIGLRSNGNEA